MSFQSFPNGAKGKKNRLKVGDVVEAKLRWLDWHVSRLSWIFGINITNDDSYGKGEKEITETYYKSCYFLLDHKLTGKLPKGTVEHYGFYDNNDGIDRKYVWIRFKLKTSFGYAEYATYCSESDMKLVKKKKK